MELSKSITDKKNSSSENLNPNSTPSKSASKNPVIVAMKQRKFVKVNKNNHNDAATAYNNLRASQEEFFNNRSYENEGIEEEEDTNSVSIEIDVENNNEEESKEIISMSSNVVKRRREMVLEEARNSVPENGVGRVMHLVKAFEKLLSIPNSKNEDDEDDNNNNKNKNVMKWALPGLQQKCDQINSDSLFCQSDLVLTSQNLGLDQKVSVSVSSSWDSSHASVSSRNSSGGRRSRRNSLESSGTLGGRRWKKKKQLKVTSQKPFKLRTEQRGKLKEEEFMNKLQQMMSEEEKLRKPVAQGLPWTTDKPECLVKPPVKESTKPIDLKLHSDVRAIDRAEFDHQVAEKMSLMEQYRLEKERQQKLEEEEKIRRLRKELVPKAQPMPYFDRPFVPRRSMKHPTIPKEPRFHIPQHKKIKCCLSWNDMNPCSSYLN
ncbi:PREDICTED: suppressor of Mek1-like isoform X2 [Lupinus angustifolius]|uniref:suppressor of Mek1-like isoform X2 n=1 Tax=Lupinus angustifolius TaxID=3871 RepID=UPI00092F0D69|nr:PREDICTED: suppressor of Mek1-like isoform X2 [Lupinus angustifolius]